MISHLIAKADALNAEVDELLGCCGLHRSHGRGKRPQHPSPSLKVLPIVWGKGGGEERIEELGLQAQSLNFRVYLTPKVHRRKVWSLKGQMRRRRSK